MRTVRLLCFAAILAVAAGSPLAVAAPAPALPSAPLERDLGQGLAYVRVHALPADLPDPAAFGRRPCVVDLRYVAGGDPEAAALLAWLKRVAGVHSPVFLLANAATSGPLLAPLNSPDAVIGLVIVGASAPGFSPDISVHVAPADERRAYEALEKGATVESLLTDRVIKSRNDEATLARSRLPDDGTDDADPAPPAATAAQPPPLVDPVLQRAVQLHRTLLALKRL
jgi:hypothetical protein